MKIFIFLFCLVPFIAGIGFTLQGHQEFCIYFDNTQNNTDAYVIFHPEEFRDKLIQFNAISPSGASELVNFHKPYEFHDIGEYQFCAKNLEYRIKNASIYINNLTIETPAEINNVFGMEYFVDRIYENLNIIEEGVKTRDQLSLNQNNISVSNNERLNLCSIAKIIVLAFIMFAQICILKYFINKKH